MKNSYLSLLQDLKEKNLYRSLVDSDLIAENVISRDGKKLISFASNDYLSLSQNPQVKAAAIEAIEKFGVGSGASKYVTGNNSLNRKLEKALAKFKNCEDALVFSSGYASSIGVISALVGDGDLIVADRLIHASLIDGAKLSAAKLIRFLHNDITSARKILSESRYKFKKCLIITETVFSMDGDLGCVEELLKLAQEFDCLLIEDSAHDLLRGQTPNIMKHLGSKVQDSGGQTPSNFSYLNLGTFSKAFGSLGGFVCGEAVVIDYLRNFARSQIYSTALPPAVLAASLASLKIIQKENLGKKALENAQYFCELMNLPEAQSAIVPIILGDEKKVLEIAKKLEEKGILISAIRPPTVEKGKARLRISFSSHHSKKQIEDLVKILKQQF
jgi:8-amino-7-oxononanoate synthase